MNFKQKHKDYLKEHNLNSITDVAWHVEKVKKDGGNRQMMMDFAWLLINEKDCLESFFAENNPAYNKQADLVQKLAFDLKQDRMKAKGFPSDYLIDEVMQKEIIITNGDIKISPSHLSDSVVYMWRPKDSQEVGKLSVEKVHVHPNPFNTGDYCAKKERVRDVEALKDPFTNGEFVNKWLEEVKKQKTHLVFDESSSLLRNLNDLEAIKKEGIKETEGKLFYELDFEFIKQMAERMQSNKDNSKYPLWNWKKPLSEKDVENLKQAMWRHVMAVMCGELEDDGREFGHLEAIANNAMMINYQLKNVKK